jgi:hypothetical protein
VGDRQYLTASSLTYLPDGSGRIQGRPRSSGRTGVAVAARGRHLCEVHAGRREAVRLILASPKENGPSGGETCFGRICSTTSIATCSRNSPPLWFRSVCAIPGLCPCRGSRLDLLSRQKRPQHWGELRPPFQRMSLSCHPVVSNEFAPGRFVPNQWPRRLADQANVEPGQRHLLIFGLLLT